MPAVLVTELAVSSPSPVYIAPTRGEGVENEQPRNTGMVYPPTQRWSPIPVLTGLYVA